MESRSPNWLVIRKGSEWQIEQVDTPTFRVSRLLTCYDVRQKSPRAANVIRTAAFQAAARAARSNARKPDCASLPANTLRPAWARSAQLEFGRAELCCDA